MLPMTHDCYWRGEILRHFRKRRPWTSATLPKEYGLCKGSQEETTGQYPGLLDDFWIWEGGEKMVTSSTCPALSPSPYKNSTTVTA